MGFLSNRINPSELVAGDHIYSYRKSWGYLFPHHGLFVGGDKVVHFMGDTSLMLVVSRSEISPYCEGCRFHGSLTGVVTSCLKCFLKGGILRRFRYGVGWWERVTSVRGVCSMTRSDDALEVVLQRASFFERRRTFGVYDVMRNNCLHFVYYCKTGRILADADGGRDEVRAAVEVEGSIVEMVRGRTRSWAWVLANAFLSCFLLLLNNDQPPADVQKAAAGGDPVRLLVAPPPPRCCSRMRALSLLRGLSGPLLLPRHSHAS